MIKSTSTAAWVSLTLQLTVTLTPSHTCTRCQQWPTNLPLKPIVVWKLQLKPGLGCFSLVGSWKSLCWCLSEELGCRSSDVQPYKKKIKILAEWKSVHVVIFRSPGGVFLYHTISMKQHPASDRIPRHKHISILLHIVMCPWHFLPIIH